MLVIVVVFLVQIWKRLRTAEKNEAEGDVQNELRSLRENVSRSEQGIRDEIRTNQNASTNTLGEFGGNLTTQVESMRQAVDDRLREVNRGIGEMQNASMNTLGEFGGNLTTQVESMRQAVDDRLEEVHRGIGGMQNIAETVNNLNQILTRPGDRGKVGRS